MTTFVATTALDLWLFGTEVAVTLITLVLNELFNFVIRLVVTENGKMRKITANKNVKKNTCSVLVHYVEQLLRRVMML